MLYLIAAWAGAMVGFVLGAMMAHSQLRERVNAAEKRAHELLVDREQEVRDLRILE